MQFRASTSRHRVEKSRLLASYIGEINLLMVARASPVPALEPFTPIGWVYETCERPASGVDYCPGDPKANWRTCPTPSIGSHGSWKSLGG